MKGTTSALTQAYMNGNVVQPVREANKKKITLLILSKILHGQIV